MNNLDKPANPISEEETDRIIDRVEIYTGLTKRESACIQLGIPESGDPELDALIRKSNRQKAAVAAMEGMLANPDTTKYYVDLSEDPKVITRAISIDAVQFAESLYNELEKPTEK